MNINTLLAQEKTTIYYIGDPMCSWCYGFAPEITKVKNHFKNIDFKIVTGGLRPNGKETMNDLADFLTHHWKDVQNASNQPFKYEILDKKDFVYDTEPACRATLVAREMNPEIELDFFKAIQTAFYSNNKNTNHINTYLEIAELLELDEDVFTTLFKSEELKDKTKKDFELAAKMGVSGFPAVIISTNGKLKQVCNGYMKAEKLIENITNNL